MDYRDSADLSRTRTRRVGSGGSGGLGGLGGGRIALGGGIGGVLVLLLALVVGPQLGINVSDLMGGSGASNQAADLSHCSGTDVNVNDNPECRWEAYETAVQAYWASEMSSYKHGDMVIFSGVVSTACGTGQSQMGPFYCSGDSTVYIDDQFMGQLLDQLGAQGGHAAELYIVAHEYGHHVQNLDGTLTSTARDKGEDSQQVRLELQADCYAGVFFYNTVRDPNSPIARVTEDDLRRITDAAKSVGDDHIQRQQGGFVNPESWTHGSSEQRQRWLTIGFTTGDPAQCNTFATNDL